MSDSTRIWHWNDDVSVLSEALDRRAMLAIPTESSYGLAVDPTSELSVETVYRFKGRPAAKALPVVVGDLDQLRALGADADGVHFQELARLWPAPLTVVVPIARPLPASGGTRTLAVRIPAHRRLRHLLLELGRPLTATSANPTGGQPVSDPERLRSMLGGWPSVIIDDGVLAGGPPSTLVQIAEEGYRVLRLGALSVDWLRERLGRPVFSAAPAEIPADDSRRSP